MILDPHARMEFWDIFLLDLFSHIAHEIGKRKTSSISNNEGKDINEVHISISRIRLLRDVSI